MAILEDLEYIYVSFNKIRSIAHVSKSSILGVKLIKYLHARYRGLYVIFLYNFWSELTLSSLP